MGLQEVQKGVQAQQEKLVKEVQVQAQHEWPEMAGSSRVETPAIRWRATGEPQRGRGEQPKGKEVAAGPGQGRLSTMLLPMQASSAEMSA